MVGLRKRLEPDEEAGASLKVGLGGIAIESPLFLGEGGESMRGGNFDDWSKGEPSSCSYHQRRPLGSIPLAEAALAGAPMLSGHLRPSGLLSWSSYLW